MYREIKAEVEKAIDLAREHYPNSTIRMPRIEFSRKMTSCAGKSINYHDGIRTGIVRFSTPIIEDNGLEAFIERTVYHEVAHTVEWEVFGTSGHGARFKYIQGVIFGKDNSRCHSFKTRKRGSTFVYRCDGCGKEIELGKVRHQRQQSGHANYTHSACGRRGTLKLLTKESVC